MCVDCLIALVTKNRGVIVRRFPFLYVGKRIKVTENCVGDFLCLKIKNLRPR